MEAFYEESVVSSNQAKEERKYKILHVLSCIFLFLGIIGVVIGIMYVNIKMLLLWVLICLPFFVFAILFRKFKMRYNVSYDYCFVSGELRISKVVGANKRKGLVKIDSESIIQIGDVDNGAYERLAEGKDVEVVICTPNAEPAEDKFFMYILTQNEGKTLYLLECRELLLMNIMKFAKRTALEREYVMQEKKEKKV